MSTTTKTPFSSSILIEAASGRSLDEVGRATKLNESKAVDLKIKSDVKTRLGFFIKSEGSFEGLFFYQTGDGSKYVTNRDYIYSWEGKASKGLKEQKVWVFRRSDNAFITGLNLKLYASPAQVSELLKSFGSFGPWNAVILLDSGVTNKEREQIANAPPFQPEPEPVPEKHEVTGAGSSVSTALGDFELIDNRHTAVIVTFEWNYTATSVELIGSFDNWKTRYPLHSEGTLVTRLHLEPGTYQYKFIVDKKQWCYDMRKPYVRDPQGNINNVVHVVSRPVEPALPPILVQQPVHATLEAVRKNKQPEKAQAQPAKKEAKQQKSPAPKPEKSDAQPPKETKQQPEGKQKGKKQAPAKKAAPQEEKAKVETKESTNEQQEQKKDVEASANAIQEKINAIDAQISDLNAKDAQLQSKIDEMTTKVQETKSTIEQLQKPEPQPQKVEPQPQKAEEPQPQKADDPPPQKVVSAKPKLAHAPSKTPSIRGRGGRTPKVYVAVAKSSPPAQPEPVEQPPAEAPKIEPTPPVEAPKVEVAPTPDVPSPSAEPQPSPSPITIQQEIPLESTPTTEAPSNKKPTPTQNAQKSSRRGGPRGGDRGGRRGGARYVPKQ